MQTRLNHLQNEIEQLKESRAHAMAQVAAGEQRMQEIIAEMAALGVTPETIEATIADLKTRVTSSVEQLEAMLANIRTGNYQAVIIPSQAAPTAQPAPVAQPTPAVGTIPISAPTAAAETFILSDDLFENL